MQSKIFVPLLSALSLSGLVDAQDGRVPLPAVTAGVVSCGGCYAVAGVAGIFFGEQTLTVTQTNNMVVSNATTVVTNSVQFDTDSFTISGPSGGVLPPAPTDVPAITSFDIGGTAVTIGGQTLTGPNAVNVFTAYSTTRTTTGADGLCSILLGSPTPVSPAFTVDIPSTVTDVAGFSSFQLQAESQFFNQFGYPQGCTGGGVNYAIISRVSVTVVTTNITSTANRTVAPATISTTPTSTVVVAVTTTSTAEVGTNSLIGPAFTSGSNVTFVTPSSGQSVIVVGPTSALVSTSTEVNTIIQVGNANHQSALSALLSGALAMIVGFVA